MNGSKISGDGPSSQKELNQVISSTHSRIMGLERYDKDLSEILSRVIRIGVSINDQEHPSKISEPINHNTAEIKPVNDLDARRPPALLGKIFDIGETSEAISISLNKQLRSIRESLDYIERFI